MTGVSRSQPRMASLFGLIVLFIVLGLPLIGAVYSILEPIFIVHWWVTPGEPKL